MSLFTEDTRIETITEGHYRAQVGTAWSIMNTPNGGYLMALMGEAAKLYAKLPQPALITVNYSGRTQEGASLDIFVERFGSSRQFDRLEITAKQGDKLVMKAMATFMAGFDDGAVEIEEKPPAMGTLDQCEARAGLPGLSVFDNVEMRLDPSCAGWMKGENRDKAEIVGWMRIPSLKQWTPAGLMLACDACPPSIFASRGPIGWVPTIEMTLHIKAIPSSEWLKVRFHSKYIGGSLLEEDGEMWDEDGNLVAVCRQLAQFAKSS